MTRKKNNRAGKKFDFKWRRILSGGLIALAAVWVLLAIISHCDIDFRPETDGMIYPPPRPIENWGGPAGAMAANFLLKYFGYMSIIVPLLLCVIGISRIFLFPLKKNMIVTGEMIAGHGILAALLAMPGGSLAASITGGYGASLASGLKSVFGNIGAYFAGIFLFVIFIAAAVGLDIKGATIAASRGISGAGKSLAARKKRREARKESSREEVIAQYEEKNRAGGEYKGLTGSIVPGGPIEMTEPVDQEPEIEPDVEQEKGPARMTVSFSPNIIRSGFKHEQSKKVEPERPAPPPPPPPAGAIDTRKLLEEARLAEKKTAPEPDLSPIDEKASIIEAKLRAAMGEGEIEPIITSEDPLPEPIPPDSPENFEKKAVVEPIPSKKPERPKTPYRYRPPPMDILTEHENLDTNLTDTALKEKSDLLIKTLNSFKVEGEIRNICPGPVITRYEFEPAMGIKVSRIANLADDIALALRAQDIRIVAPIPGKGAVGIEVPNDHRETVRLRTILEYPAFRGSDYALPLALGKRVDGQPAVADLAKMPHLLIAGSTGSGKSVCMNTIISSLVYYNSPTDLRIIMIDPKRLELSVYKGIPHLTAPIVVEPKDASHALNWAVEEMNARYKKLSLVGVRSIAAYNELVKERADEGLEKLPNIVVLIDEMADLMSIVSSEIEEPIVRLAQMARAVGIHLVIATQRPSVDVVTGLIKANFPSRIAFKVRSKIDSRTILDMSGAERLLGYGDMLYLPSGCAEPIRIHGSLVTTAETERIVKYLRTFPNPYPDSMINFEEVARSSAVSAERDELFKEAAKIVVMYQQGSTSFLQRKLRVGYTRAGCIIDQLEMEGIVGPFQGSKARDVLIDSLDVLEKMLDTNEME